MFFNGKINDLSKLNVHSSCTFCSEVSSFVANGIEKGHYTSVNKLTRTHSQYFLNNKNLPLCSLLQLCIQTHIDYLKNY